MISEKQAAESMLTTLRLAEIYERWDLFAALIRYFKAAGVKLGRVDGVWQMEIPAGHNSPSKGN